MTKVMTIVGTRPEIVRLSSIIPLLDSSVDHVLVHTGQNFERTLSDVFFEELSLRVPDENLGAGSSDLGEQLGNIFSKGYPVLQRHQPDLVLVLGDTNSALLAILARRLGIPVVHMEAGNRAYDSRVPEEVNRRIIDHTSSILLPYTERSKENLLAEGLPRERIHVIGNPIGEVLSAQMPAIERSDVLARMGLETGKYLLATLHRAETVDRRERLSDCLAGMEDCASELSLPVICSTHPRTRAKMKELGISGSDLIRFVDPLGFHDFVKLQKSARCVLTDSGTVPEECAILGVPSVILREVTERPEMLESGCSVLGGTSRTAISEAVRWAISRSGWEIPREYAVSDVSSRVAGILLACAGAYSPSSRKLYDR